ncbi:MAG TPA: lamin tail domain-containing protein [Candidatus Tidjanibacter gallistercoris]|nr:lamin tail domain-containing protein [Candidatus Tidjanibacter gallistercoris]
MKKIVCAVLLAATAAVSCKNDRESDVTPGDSAVEGLYINEVYSCNPDWVELYNAGSEELHIGGFILQDDKGAEEEYVLPEGTTIGAGAFLVIEEFSFGISSSKGDRVTLLDASRSVVDDVLLPVMEDGASYGRSTDGGAKFTTFDTPTKGASNTGGGTVPEPEPSVTAVRINEVLSAPAGDDADFIELYNGGEQDADVGGFVLQDDKGAAEEFVIPEGTVIPAGGFLVYEQVSPGAGESFTFGLSSKGDRVTLLDASRSVADEVETPDFGNTKGASYARTVDGGGEWRIAAVPTKGTSNAGGAEVSLKGVLFINEVYTYADGSREDDLDFIELYNAGESEIALAGLKLWESGGSAEAWTFPEDAVIAAGGFFVVVCDKDSEWFADPVHYPVWGLSKGPDEYVTLADADMNEIDYVACPSMKRGESYGRVSDGAAQWQVFAAFTKGAPNEGPARQPVTNTIGLWVNEVFSNNQDTAELPWNESVDFIEFYNSGDAAIDFGGYVIKDDKGADDESYTVPAGTMIPAGGFFTCNVYKDNPEGPSFGLGKGGDWVFVYNPAGELVAELEVPAFADDEILSWGRMPDGGDALQKMEPTKNRSNDGTAAPAAAVVINEVLTNGSQEEDWVEFYNGGGVDVDMKGYVLYDDGGIEKAFTFPAGAVVPAGGYLVLVAKEPGSFDFGLGKKGDALTLLDASGAVADEVELPALDDDETYGRRSDGTAEWVVFTASTRGASNAGGTVRE